MRLSLRPHLTLPTDCGESSSSDSRAAAEDPTGDAYEDYPDDHPSHEDLTGPEYLKIATNVKEYGNKAFKGGDLQLGLEKYLKALRYLNEYPKATETDTNKDEKKAQITALRFTLHSNSALLHNKLGEYADAVKSGDSALALVGYSKTGWEAVEGADAVGKPEQGKAMFRRALAKRGLKDDEEAIKDLEIAAKLVPGDAAITKELAVAKKKVEDAKKKENAAFKKFFD